MYPNRRDVKVGSPTSLRFACPLYGPPGHFCISSSTLLQLGSLLSIKDHKQTARILPWLRLPVPVGAWGICVHTLEAGGSHLGAAEDWCKDAVGFQHAPQMGTQFETYELLFSGIFHQHFWTVAEQG